MCMKKDTTINHQTPLFQFFVHSALPQHESWSYKISRDAAPCHLSFIYPYYVHHDSRHWINHTLNCNPRPQPFCRPLALVPRPSLVLLPYMLNQCYLSPSLNGLSSASGPFSLYCLHHRHYCLHHWPNSSRCHYSWNDHRCTWLEIFDSPLIGDHRISSYHCFRRCRSNNIRWLRNILYLNLFIVSSSYTALLLSSLRLAAVAQRFRMIFNFNNLDWSLRYRRLQCIWSHFIFVTNANNIIYIN